MGDIDGGYPKRGNFQALGVLGFRHFVTTIGVAFANQIPSWKGAITTLLLSDS